MTMLETVKQAVRRTDTNAFDNDLTRLINAALQDMTIAGITNATSTSMDPLIIQAVCTYCMAHFGETDEYEHLKASYDEQKAELQMSSNYTNYAQYGITSALDQIAEVENV